MPLQSGLGIVIQHKKLNHNLPSRKKPNEVVWRSQSQRLDSFRTTNITLKYCQSEALEDRWK